MALEIVTISDAAFGSRAKILPELGFNCYGFAVPTSAGPLETLWAAPDFTDGTARPTRSGIPLLFPFAGRIWGAKFRFRDKLYELEEGDDQGNAIHGFVFNRPWRVTDQSKDRVVGAFQASVDDDRLLTHWPTDFRITAEYRIARNVLSCELTVENPGDTDLPFGLGTHPYFRVPLGGPRAADCRVSVPVGEDWELEDLLPTGRHAHTALCDQLSGGMAFGEMKLDNVFGGLRFNDGRLTATVHDPSTGRTLAQTFDDSFTTCVVFNPPTRESVCIEPYTTVPDAFSLRERGTDPSLEILTPGESFRARFEIRVD